MSKKPLSVLGRDLEKLLNDRNKNPLFVLWRLAQEVKEAEKKIRLEDCF